MMQHFNEELRAYENCIVPKTSGEGVKKEKERHSPYTTSGMYVQAQASVCGEITSTDTRLLLDTGSQRTYASEDVVQRLKLKTVRFKVKRKVGKGYIDCEALCVPIVCSPIAKQDVDYAGRSFEHLDGLTLADSNEGQAEVEILIGSDFYHEFFTGLISPITAWMKTIFQLLYKDSLEWDCEVSMKIREAWFRFVDVVASAGKVTVERLVRDIERAFLKSVDLQRIHCWTDSEVARSWIKGKEKAWKDWVENRVVKIRQVVDRGGWSHVAGDENPADIPTRKLSCFDGLFKIVGLRVLLS
ncbi:uncharacterized protein [Clytia hemisphaerica]|uniref:uncharacterized protein n=1 Tax=Clytia hemisphaerica TaxID=252671 RepID=UPI0034D44BEB